MSSPALHLSTAPFVHGGLSTRRLMWEVSLALVPVLAAATWYFGVVALLVVACSTAGAVLTERLFAGARGAASLRDGSAVLTGVLLGLTLPPSVALWMAFLGGAVGIGLGKVVWGGLGQNLFNPALVGRAFLQAAFPQALTTWTEPGRSWLQLHASNLALPLMQPGADVVTTATPLGMAKFDQQVTELPRLLLGHTAGSLGETSGLVLILCGVYLAARRVFDWRLPLATLLAVAVAAGGLHLVDPVRYAGPLFMLCSGGLLYGTVFMVTDPVTTPLTFRGMWIFGAGVGLLTVLIRHFGGLPEGVMYAILLMNSVTPLINRYTQPRIFGG